MMAESRLSLTVRFIGMGTATLVSLFGSSACNTHGAHAATLSERGKVWVTVGPWLTPPRQARQTPPCTRRLQPQVAGGRYPAAAGFP